MVTSFPPVLLMAQAIQIAECPVEVPISSPRVQLVAPHQVVQDLAVLVGHVEVAPVALAFQEGPDAGVQSPRSIRATALVSASTAARGRPRRGTMGRWRKADMAVTCGVCQRRSDLDGRREDV